VSEPSTRERVRRHVSRHPGVHFSELVRALDIAPGQAQHHLRRLVGDGLTSASLYGRTHYYPEDVTEWEQGALALLRRETARAVVETVLADGPIEPAAVADRVGVARSTVAWHVDRLSECDVVERRYDDDGRVALAVVRPRATARLLATVDPSLVDRLVDRFDRLVDDVLLGPDERE
jgi:predicted transcriptional regulator